MLLLCRRRMAIAGFCNCFLCSRERKASGKFDKPMRRYLIARTRPAVGSETRRHKPTCRYLLSSCGLLPLRGGDHYKRVFRQKK
jgi:hypothetical protein